MILHTIQMSSYRKASKLNIPFYDVTVKSGDKLFAPSWDILMRYKNNADIEEREETYMREFTTHMRESYKNNKHHWINFLSQDEVAIACFCKSGSFCHRKILVAMFEKVCKVNGIEFKCEGELM